MRRCPLDDPRGLGDHLSLVGDENRHHLLTAQLLDLATTVGGPLEDTWTDPEAANLDHLGSWPAASNA